ncbi:MAG: D-alanyl-D-alanine carboxypeptidase/D-alanyl-D-alanine-endopeptidase [Pseudomonadota bacterium]
MTRLSRRTLLSGLAALAATPAVARAPELSLRPLARGEAPPQPASPPATSLIRAAGIGGAVGYLVVNAETGQVVEAHNPTLRLPPASVTKAATAYFALSRLGVSHRFRTRLVATGPVEDGILKGDLILQGGGDPNLDTDGLADMVTRLRTLGVHKVDGAFRVDASALPTVPFIDPDQPVQVGYNPAVSGLNLNFNRVHFEWKRAGTGYNVTMQARAVRNRPDVAIARMAIEDRAQPVYTYTAAGGVDRWSVAKRYLGQGGARWLPVKRPVDYAAEVFVTLANSQGLNLTREADVDGVEGEALVTHSSAGLSDMLRAMLKYSTNLTAEAVGLAAAQAGGTSPTSLIRSAREMNLWYNREIGCHSTGFVDHSGLGYGSRVSAADMVHILQTAQNSAVLPTLLKPFNVENKAIKVMAKTGTLNFVSALAGYIKAPGTPDLIFAIFTADMPRRDAIPISQRERPSGAKSWSNRSRGLQRQLIRRWVTVA